MSSFDDRENAFEAKFAHDESLLFKATARRNKLLGHWAAALLGKEGEAAEEYAKEVVRADFEEPGDDDVIRKVAGDLGDKASDEDIRAQLEALMNEAKAQIADEA